MYASITWTSICSRPGCTHFLAPHTSRTADSFSLSKHNFWLTHTYTYMQNTHTCLHIRLFPISLWLQLLICFFPFFWAAAKYFICNALARCPCPEEGKYGRRGRAACLAILLPLQMMGSSWTTLEAVAVAKAWPTFYVGHARVLLQRLLTMLIGRRRFCPNVHFTNSFEYPASGPSHVCMCVCVCLASWTWRYKADGPFLMPLLQQQREKKMNASGQSEVQYFFISFGTCTLQFRQRMMQSAWYIAHSLAYIHMYILTKVNMSKEA